MKELAWWKEQCERFEKGYKKLERYIEELEEQIGIAEEALQEGTCPGENDRD